MKSLPLTVVLPLAVLAGCATNQLANDPAQLGLDLMSTNQNQLAYNVLTQCAQAGNSACWNNLGVMYDQGRIGAGRDVNAAIAHFTIAARYGLPVAQRNLILLGAPVPPADLAVVQAQQQAAYQQQQAQNNQLAGQLGGLLGCALAGGNCSPSNSVAPVRAPIEAPVMPKACTWDHECGVRGVCLKQQGAQQGICATR